MFWLTFREMARILKVGGYIYINAPSNGAYHKCPGDNWRFYSDAGQALAYWSCRQVANEEVYPMKLIETFHILPNCDKWIDFVGVWERTDDELQTEIVVPKDICENVGPFEAYLVENTPTMTAKKMKGLQLIVK